MAETSCNQLHIYFQLPGRFAVAGHANLPGSWKAAPQSVATGGNGDVTIRVGSKTEVCGILV